MVRGYKRTPTFLWINCA